MKVLFLDVDGVLNIMGPTYNSHGFDNLGSDPIEPHLMKRLEFIIDRVKDLKIVISSSWFEEQLKRRLIKLRFKYMDRIIGRTNRSSRYRGDQIKEWLDDHPNVTEYIILEDEIMDICGEKCNVIPKKNVIEVDGDEGLSNENAVNSIIRLNRLEKNDGTEYLATIENISIFVNIGYRPQVDISNVTVNNNPFESFSISNKHLMLYMVRKEKDK